MLTTMSELVGGFELCFDQAVYWGISNIKTLGVQPGCCNGAEQLGTQMYCKNLTNGNLILYQTKVIINWTT